MHPILVFLLDQSRGLFKRPPVVLVLLLNLIPVAGVTWWGWNILTLLLLYWAENVVLGVINVLKMLVLAVREGPVGIFQGVLMIPFFIIHYGMFCVGHLLFAVLVGGGGFQGGDLVQIAQGVWDERMRYFWPVMALAAVHLAGLFDWLVRGGWRTTDLNSQMGEPYGRIIILHITILVGAALIEWLKWPAAGVALLAVLKTVYEVTTTNARLKKLEAAKAADPLPAGVR